MPKNIIVKDKNGCLHEFRTLKQASKFIGYAASPMLCRGLKEGRTYFRGYIVTTEERQYALYRGEQFIMVGTKDEIMEKNFLSSNCFNTLKSPKHKKRKLVRGMVISEL